MHRAIPGTGCWTLLQPVSMTDAVDVSIYKTPTGWSDSDSA